MKHSFTAVFLINRLPSKILSNRSPFEQLYGKPPDYTFLRTFGCAIWPNLRPFNSTKLQFHSKKCVFLGYSYLHKGFKCLDPSDGRIYISWDVIFDEHVFPFASLHPNAGPRLRAEMALLPPSLLGQNAGFGDAIFHDQYTSPPVTTNALPSYVDHTGDKEKKFSENGAQLHIPGRHFMQLHEGDVIGSRPEVDAPVPRTDAQSASDHPPAPCTAPRSASTRPPSCAPERSPAPRAEPTAPAGSSAPPIDNAAASDPTPAPQPDPTPAVQSPTTGSSMPTAAATSDLSLRTRHQRTPIFRCPDLLLHLRLQQLLHHITTQLDFNKVLSNLNDILTGQLNGATQPCCQVMSRPQ